MTSRDIALLAAIVLVLALVFSLCWLLMQPPPIGYGLDIGSVELNDVWKGVVSP